MPESYSQFGEDVEILSFLKSDSGFFLDVGANDGIRDSNTLLLEKHGWKGILVEANPKLSIEAGKARPNSIVINAAACDCQDTKVTFSSVSLEGGNLDGLSSLSLDPEARRRIKEMGGRIEEIEVLSTRLDSILADHLPLNTALDFVSLDIEGAELDALGGFNIQSHHPRLVLVEDNRRGADPSIYRWMKKNGYCLVHRTGWNEWYVPQSSQGGFLLRRITLRLRLLKWSIERFLLKAKGLIMRSR